MTTPPDKSKHVFGAMSMHEARLIGVDIRLGHRLAAVRELRDSTGWTATRAKDFIERYLPFVRGDDFDYREARDRFLRENFAFVDDFIEKDEMLI